MLFDGTYVHNRFPAFLQAGDSAVLLGETCDGVRHYISTVRRTLPRRRLEVKIKRPLLYNNFIIVSYKRVVVPHVTSNVRVNYTRNTTGRRSI